MAQCVCIIIYRGQVRGERRVGGWGGERTRSRFLRRLMSHLAQSLLCLKNELGATWSVLRTGFCSAAPQCLVGVLYLYVNDWLVSLISALALLASCIAAERLHFETDTGTSGEGTSQAAKPKDRLLGCISTCVKAFCSSVHSFLLYISSWGATEKKYAQIIHTSKLLNWKCAVYSLAICGFSPKTAYFQSDCKWPKMVWFECFLFMEVDVGIFHVLKGQVS